MESSSLIELTLQYAKAIKWIRWYDNLYHRADLTADSGGSYR